MRLRLFEPLTSSQIDERQLTILFESLAATFNLTDHIDRQDGVRSTGIFVHLVGRTLSVLHSLVKDSNHIVDIGAVYDYLVFYEEST